MNKKANNLFFLLKVFLVWRVSLFLVSFLASSVLFRPDFAYTSPCFYKEGCSSFEKNFLYAWANFDGAHYLNIAAKGYTDQARFLPFYPLLIRLFSFFAVDEINLFLLIVSLLISNLSLLLALFLAKKIFNFSEKTYYWWLILFLAFPTSFFLGNVYAESLVILLVVLMFFFLKEDSWRWSVLMAALLPIVKLQGLMIWPVLIYLLIKNRKKYELDFISWFWTLIILVLPILAYIGFNQSKWQDPLYFIHAHGELANARVTSSLIFPLQTVWRYLKIMATFNFNHEYWIASLELASFSFLCWLFYLAWQNKLAFKWVIYSASIVFLPLFSGTFSGLPRYMLLAFPLWINLAKLTNSRTKKALLAVFIILQIFLTVCFLRGYFIA